MAKPTVLIVDDDPSIRKLLQEVLTLEGYPLETAADGAEALAALERGGSRLVLLDLLMPNVAGWDVMQALEANGTRAQHKIIFVSANDKLEDYRHLTPDDELAKPFTVDQLINVIQKHVA